MADPEAPTNRLDRLHHALHEAAHVLPVQGPIGVFIHHNTLHALEELPFHDAVARAHELFEAEPYLTEEEYRALYQTGRVTDDDLRVVLAEQRGPDGVLGPFQLRALDRIALLHPLWVESRTGLDWQISEQLADRRFREDVGPEARARILARSVGGAPAVGGPDDAEAGALLALWRECRAYPLALEEADHGLAVERLSKDRTPRDLLLAMTGMDANDWVHPTLIRLCASFLDAGVAYWPLPGREQGLYRAWCELVVSSALPVGWKAGLRDEVEELLRSNTEAHEVVLRELEALQVAEEDWNSYLVRVLRYLPGWAGMVHWFESHPDQVSQATRQAHLMDFLAIRLTYDRYAAKHVARTALHTDAPLTQLPALAASRTIVTDEPAAPDSAAWRLFQVAQLAGLAACDLRPLSPTERAAVLQYLDDFGSHERRRVWCEAFERRYRQQILHALAQNRKRLPADANTTRPKFQMVVCMDEREESFRRHFEELNPEHETLGAAGFFGLAIDYTGLDDGHSAPLCPIVVTPAHAVHEEADPADTGRAAMRRHRRRLLARMRHHGRLGNQTFLRGLLSLPFTGAAAGANLALEILAPRPANGIRQAFWEAVHPRPRTRLVAERREDPAEGSKPVGFLPEEMVQRVATLLANMGMTKTFARLVVFLGHGSVSMNNPHESAHDCGACGGGHGAANARLFAEFANRPDVRAGLAERGIVVPDDVVFVGGIHNTSSDAVTLFDTDRVPPSHQPDLAALRVALDQARALSAQERCRRFASAPRHPNPAQALRHVEWRAVSIAEPRPELGHATNACCIVGRRALTKGLFLDRRPFLVSYDPEGDADGDIVERILAAVGPVGAGISLEYYFSNVDNLRYGCGTKLPHNLSGLLGVMDGASSDLRTGLPKQMVDIHEPMRLLVIVEARPEILAAVRGRQPELKRLLDNQWIQLVSVHPKTGKMVRFIPGVGFEDCVVPRETLPVVANSHDWYDGKRGFVAPAIVESPRRNHRAA